MRLLQWFHYFEPALLRSTADTVGLGLTESGSVSVIVVSDPEPFASDSFSLSLTEVGSIPPININSASTIPIGIGEAVTILPFDPPLGTGDIPVHLIEDADVFVTYVEIFQDLTAVGLGESLFIFAGILIKADSDIFAAQLTEAIIFSLPLAVGTADSFITNLIEGFVADVSFTTLEIPSLETIPLTLAESSQIAVIIEQLDVLPLSLLVSTQNNVAVSLIDIIPLALIDSSQLLLSINRADLIPLDMNEKPEVLVSLTSTSEGLMIGITDTAEIYLTLIEILQDIVAVGLEESTIIFAGALIKADSDVFAVTLTEAIDFSFPFTVGAADLLTTNLTEDFIVNTSLTSLEIIPLILVNDNQIAIIVTTQVALPIGVIDITQSPFLVADVVDALQVISLESEGSIVSQDIPEEPALTGFPGLQMTWDDDPYLSLK